MKDTISDPEKHMGRFTREDKVCFICSKVFFFFYPNLFHTRWVAGDISGRLACSRKNSQLPLPNGRSSVSGLSNFGKGGTFYNGLYRETFPERGNFYKLQVYKR